MAADQRPMTLNPADPAFKAQLLTDLSEEVFRPVEARYLEEPRGRYHGQEALLALPRTVEEVATLIRHANVAGVGGSLQEYLCALDGGRWYSFLHGSRIGTNLVSIGSCVAVFPCWCR